VNEIKHHYDVNCKSK